MVLAQANGAGGGLLENLGIMPLIVMIGVLFYFMILRPETQRRGDQEKMHKELKKNDRVLTIGGIYGTIVNATAGSEDITIKVDESTNTKLRVTRSAVQKILNQKEDSGNK